MSVEKVINTNARSENHLGSRAEIDAQRTNTPNC